MVFGDRLDESGRIHPFAKFPVQIGAWQLVAVFWALIAAQVSLLLARWRWPLAGAIVLGVPMIVHGAAEIVYLVTDQPITMVNAATVVVALVPVELAIVGLLARWLRRQARLEARVASRLPPACV